MITYTSLEKQQPISPQHLTKRFSVSNRGFQSDNILEVQRNELRTVEIITSGGSKHNLKLISIYHACNFQFAQSREERPWVALFRVKNPAMDKSQLTRFAKGNEFQSSFRIEKVVFIKAVFYNRPF